MTDAHANTRLEAFCDGVFAIALTLLILDVKLPAAESVASYSLLAIAAFWCPIAIALVTTLSWIFWLVLGIRMKEHGSPQARR